MTYGFDERGRSVTLAAIVKRKMFSCVGVHDRRPERNL